MAGFHLAQIDFSGPSLRLLLRLSDEALSNEVDWSVKQTGNQARKRGEGRNGAQRILKPRPVPEGGRRCVL